MPIVRRGRHELTAAEAELLAAAEAAFLEGRPSGAICGRRVMPSNQLNELVGGRTTTFHRGCWLDEHEPVGECAPRESNPEPPG